MTAPLLLKKTKNMSIRQSAEEKRLQKELNACSKELYKQDEKVKQLAEENKMMLEALCKISSRLAFLDFGVKSGSASDKQISSAYQISEQAIAKAEGSTE